MHERAPNPQARSGPRHIFDSRARAVLSCTLVVGTVVAVAPAIPAAVRLQGVFAALVAWTAAVTWGTISAIALARRSLPRNFATAATALAVIGIGATVLAITQLEIIRLLYDRPALTWNIDWRFHLNHAQAIARYAGVHSALDYAGVPVNYHVGPAWLAGATERVLGRGIYAVSFGLVPLLCTLCTAIAALYALHVHGLPYRLAAAAAAIVMTLPGLRNTPRGLYYVLTGGNPAVLSDVWTFSPGLMLNSSFGLAVGMASLALLLDRRSRDWQVVLASVGLASLVVLKPQFFVGVGLLIGLLAIERVVGRGASTPRTTWVFGAAAGALVIGVALAALSPSSAYMSYFAHPVWAPGRTGYSLSEPFTNATLLFLLVIATWSAMDLTKSRTTLLGAATVAYIGMAAFPGVRNAAVPLLFALAVSSMITLRGRPAMGAMLCYGLVMRVAAAMTILVAGLYLIGLPVRPDMVAQAQRLVEPAFSANSEQGNLAQALGPLRLLLVTSALGLLAVRAAQGTTWWRRAFCTAGTVSVMSFVPLITFAFFYPLRGYEAAEDVGLLQTLREVPRDGQLLIASDLADPAEHHHRALRAFLLTGYTGHAFYVANLRYMHYARPDAAGRLEELRAFFGSPWSAWHTSWLQHIGVGYILVSDRCLPSWFNQPGVPLRPRAHHGQWIVYDTPDAKLRSPPTSMPTGHELTPRFGAQGCLSFRETEPT